MRYPVFGLYGSHMEQCYLLTEEEEQNQKNYTQNIPGGTGPTLAKLFSRIYVKATLHSVYD